MATVKTKVFLANLILIFMLIPCFSEAGFKEQIINLPLEGLTNNINELSYVMGVGDIDGDKETDFVIRVWSEEDNLKNKIETRSYAYRHDGQLLWELNHHIIPSDFDFEPCAMTPMTVWDFDADGKDELVTLLKLNGAYQLVMLDGTAGSKKIEKQADLAEASKFIYGALAFLDGVNPSIVIATGKQSKVIAFDQNLNRIAEFDDPNHYAHHDCVWLLSYDFDEDGRDELVHGPLLLNEDLTIYYDATVYGFPDNALTGRSMIADIDPQNPGYEWYIQGSGKSGEYHVEPNQWKGPYLLDVDKKEILWHENLDQRGTGWGRMHRGWLQDVRPDIPGLEMFCTGYYWEDNEWQDALDGKYKIRPNGVWAGDYWETYKIYSAKSEILISSHGTRVGYPVMWDDDPEAEYFMYRNGQLLDNFFSDKIIAHLAKQDGSGECTIADILGDWREEIIVTDNDGKVHIYSNNEPTIYPNRPSPRKGHNYLMHLASIGSGLPKPVPPDAGWFENINQ
jgi:hypothetical protein